MKANLLGKEEMMKKIYSVAIVCFVLAVASPIVHSYKIVDGFITSRIFFISIVGFILFLVCGLFLREMDKIERFTPPKSDQQEE